MDEPELPDNVHILGGPTKLDLPPNRVLRAPIDQLECVVLAGIDKNGDFWFASSTSDKGKQLLLLEHYKAALLEVES